MKPLIVANWKCNPTSSKKAEGLLNLVEKEIKGIKNVEVVICPPFIYLSRMKSRISRAKLGAQDVFWGKEGPYTGEVSPPMLKDAGCRYVIIGHSERRRYFGESNEEINRKIGAALEWGLSPILCLGETAKERKEGKTGDVLKRQIKTALRGLRPGRRGLRLSIAYEPLWAIGTGRPSKPEEAKKTLSFLKKTTARFIRPPFPQPLFLYGGSADSENCLDYLRVGFDGLLVGGASLKSREFIKIIRKSATLASSYQ